MLSVAQLLAVWERAARHSWARRALALLVAAHPGVEAEALARLPIGERDARLFRMREALFGAQLDCLASCPRCGEWLEASFSVEDVRRSGVAGVSDADAVQHVHMDDHDVSFRLPNSHDLVALEACHDAGDAEQRLVAGCLVEARERGQAIVPDALPAQLVAAVARRMAETDPAADVQLGLTCTACGNRWHATFDIVTHLWTEIDGWARRILDEVHALASAYGWSERDILAMTPARRQQYLDLLGA
jgi:hypothetical protein